MKRIAWPLAAFLIAGCSLAGTPAPTKAPALPTGVTTTTPAPTFDLMALAQEYLIVAGDSNKVLKALLKQCPDGVGFKQQRTCWAKMAEIQQTLLKAYTELSVPPPLQADFAALRQAVAAYIVVLRQGAMVKTIAALRAIEPKIAKAASLVTAAANKVRADLGLPPAPRL
jgi:hypothetical protein